MYVGASVCLNVYLCVYVYVFDCVQMRARSLRCFPPLVGNLATQLINSY